MSNRYWVGNDGNWSDNTKHWSATSNGSPNASKPTSADSVFFDVSSFVKETSITSVCVFNNKLYGGTYPAGKLFEWNGTDAWIEKAPQLNSQQIIYSMCVFNNKLYASTYPHCKLFEWNGTNAWVEKAPQYGSESYGMSLSVYNNKLYVASYPSGNLLEWNGTNAWVSKAPQLNAQYIYALSVFNSKLYAGTFNGGRLFEWNDSNAWVQKAPQLNSEQIIRSLCVFNNKLYGGTGTSGKLHEWNGTDAWVEKAPQLNGQNTIFTLYIYNSKLYAGTGTGGRLFEWNGTNAWVEKAPTYGSEASIQGLGVFNSKLYGGTGTSGKLLEWDDSAIWINKTPNHGTVYVDEDANCLDMTWTGANTIPRLDLNAKVLNVHGNFTPIGAMNFTIGTSTIKMQGNTKTFTGADKAYNNIEFLGTPITIIGNNTFNDFKGTAAKTVKFTAGSTQIIVTLSGVGSVGNLVTIESVTPGTHYHISKTSGTAIVDYWSIKDSTAEGGATFYATNSTNASGNTGWIFDAIFSTCPTIIINDVKVLTPTLITDIVEGSGSILSAFSVSNSTDVIVMYGTGNLTSDFTVLNTQDDMVSPISGSVDTSFTTEYQGESLIIIMRGNDTSVFVVTGVMPDLVVIPNEILEVISRFIVSNFASGIILQSNVPAYKGSFHVMNGTLYYLVNGSYFKISEVV